MLISASISFDDRSVFVKIGNDVDDLENNKKGIYAKSRHMSDEDLIFVSKTVISMAVSKFMGYKDGEKSKEYIKFQLQDSSSIKWTEEQKHMLRIAEEFVSRNRSSIKNYKSKETRKEKRRQGLKTKE